MNRTESCSPSTVVAHLDRYVIGQTSAKRAVAVALRNRVRRRKLPEEMAREIAPKNILMVGPTGVGKTEIARRMARLVDAPFVKVEATKFTEVGYVGRDVESMIRDLVEAAIQMVKACRIDQVQAEAATRAEERLLDALLPQPKQENPMENMARLLGLGNPGNVQNSVSPPSRPEPEEPRQGTREKLRELLRSGKLDAREVEVDLAESPRVGMSFVGGAGMEEMGLNIGELLGTMLPKRTKRRRTTVAEARRLFAAEEAERLVDMEAVAREALEKAQEEGVVFIDEIDKIVGAGGSRSGPDVSREGVQRDLLPLIEGSAVQTKYGPVRTDHVLFIAAGAFHKVKPSDLAPELQGRLPIRVELSPLKEEDLARILSEPENCLVRQYRALLETEGVELVFRDEAVRAIAAHAARENLRVEDIGARRLSALMERLLEEISFDAPNMDGTTVIIDESFVLSRLGTLDEDADARKYVL
jgi:ATP-dependent HslUV protease ATP-binding subunit HslU